MPLVGKELPTLPEHMSSPPAFSRVRVTRSLVLCACFVDRCVCPFVLFLVAIVLSVLRRYKDSDYPLVSSNSSYVIDCASVSMYLRFDFGTVLYLLSFSPS